MHIVLMDHRSPSSWIRRFPCRLLYHGRYEVGPVDIYTIAVNVTGVDYKDPVSDVLDLAIQKDHVHHVSFRALVDRHKITEAVGKLLDVFYKYSLDRKLHFPSPMY